MALENVQDQLGAPQFDITPDYITGTAPVNEGAFKDTVKLLRRAGLTDVAAITETLHAPHLAAADEMPGFEDIEKIDVPEGFDGDILVITLKSRTDGGEPKRIIVMREGNEKHFLTTQRYAKALDNLVPSIERGFQPLLKDEDYPDPTKTIDTKTGLSTLFFSSPGQDGSSEDTIEMQWTDPETGQLFKRVVDRNVTPVLFTRAIEDRATLTEIRETGKADIFKDRRVIEKLNSDEDADEQSYADLLYESLGYIVARDLNRILPFKFIKYYDTRDIMNGILRLADMQGNYWVIDRYVTGRMFEETLAAINRIQSSGGNREKDLADYTG